MTCMGGMEGGCGGAGGAGGVGGRGVALPAEGLPSLVLCLRPQNNKGSHAPHAEAPLPRAPQLFCPCPCGGTVVVVRLAAGHSAVQATSGGAEERS